MLRGTSGLRPTRRKQGLSSYKPHNGLDVLTAILRKRLVLDTALPSWSPRFLDLCLRGDQTHATFNHHHRRCGTRGLVRQRQMQYRPYRPACSNAGADRMSASSSVPSPTSNACSRAPAAGRRRMSRPCGASASISASPRRPNSTGPSTHRPRGSAAASLPAPMAASAPTRRSASAAAAISWSAVRANAYALQPISVQGQTGLNVAAGIAGIELEPVGFRHRGRWHLTAVTVDRLQLLNQSAEARKSGPLLFGAMEPGCGIEMSAEEQILRSHHSFHSEFSFMRRLACHCRHRRDPARCTHIRRRAAADQRACRSACSNAAAAPASASSSAPSPISAACCASRACRKTATSRPSARSASISASPRKPRWPGACSRRSRSSGPAISPAITPARRARASLGVGVGGNVLVGGSNNSIALQPLSLQGQVGVNIAAGLESLELRPGR